MNERTTRPTAEGPLPEETSSKVMQAILGAIVVVVAVLILLGVANFIRSNIFSKKTAQTTPAKKPTTQVNTKKEEPTSKAPTQGVPGYTTMPATGPRENLILVFVLFVLGASSVVLSKKYL